MGDRCWRWVTQQDIPRSQRGEVFGHPNFLNHTPIITAGSFSRGADGGFVVERIFQHLQLAVTKVPQFEHRGTTRQDGQATGGRAGARRRSRTCTRKRDVGFRK
jgi:hypothetical protein